MVTVDLARDSGWLTARPMARFDAPCCASCGGSSDLRAYGAALFCGECREMSDEFYRKDLYCDLGGGD